MNALLLADYAHTTTVIAALYAPVREILLADCCSGQKMIMTIDIFVPNFVLDNIYYCQHFRLGSSKQKVLGQSGNGIGGFQVATRSHVLSINTRDCSLS